VGLELVGPSLDVKALLLFEVAIDST